LKQPDLILFAKQPIPGQVKTRLQPPCTPEQAADIAAYLIRATTELAVSFWPSDVYLYGWPNHEHELFRELAAKYRVHLATQETGDLGDKMYSALSEGIQRKGAAAVMGCDVPHCRGAIIEQAHERLAKGGDVIGPSEDGGYYLLGLQQAPRELFRDMEWQSSMVTLKTMARAVALGLEFEFLPTLRDIDTWKDLRAAAEGFEPLRQFI